MRRAWLVILALLTLSGAAIAQTRQTLETFNNNNITANGQGLITGPIINSMNGQIINGAAFQGDANNFTGVNTATRPWTFNSINTTTYPLPNNVGYNILFNSGSTSTIPNLKEFNAIRWDQDFIIGASSGLGTGGQASLINFQLSLNAASDHSANMYGVIGQVINNGRGSTKAIYGRADCTNAIFDATYSACIAGVFNINTGVNENFAANIQMNAVTNTSGKAANMGLWLSSANADGSPALYQFGFLIDNLDIQAGFAGFQMNAIGMGDFLTLKNDIKTQNLFNVDHTGKIGTGLPATTFTGAEQLSVLGFAAIGNPGSVVGIIGNTQTGAFIVGSLTNVPLQINVDNIEQAFFTTSGLNLRSGAAYSVGAAQGLTGACVITTAAVAAGITLTTTGGIRTGQSGC